MRYGAERQTKLYYGISEVCTMTGLEKHILRYWESEFPQLRPRKNRAGNRVYRARDIDLIRRIQHLLHTERFTLEGARLKLKDWGDPVQEHAIDLLAEENGDLQEDAAVEHAEVPDDHDGTVERPHIVADEPVPLPTCLGWERAQELQRELGTILRLLRS